MIIMAPEKKGAAVMRHPAPPYQGGSILSGRAKSSDAQLPELKQSSHEYFDQSAVLDNCYWLEFNPNILDEMRQQRHPIDGWTYGSSYEPYHRPHWFPQEPVLMVPQSYAHDYYNNINQDYQYFVVIDFEATCDKLKKPQPQEIIEFPSVLVNSTTWQIEGCFQTYVRPSHNKVLSNFCTALTGIQQYQVDGGVLLSEALLLHDKWLQAKGVKKTKFAIVTWSNWDCKTMLESECRLKGIEKPSYFNQWINLKIPFAEVYGSSKCNLKSAVEKTGLTWQGRAHCGLDDAKNTANLLINLMACRMKLAVTNSLMPLSAVHPKTKPSHLAKPYKYLGTTRSTVIPPQADVVTPPQADDVIVPRVYCQCGAVGENLVLCKNEHNKGGFYFGCGYCTPKGPTCQFFKWVAPSVVVEADN